MTQLSPGVRGGIFYGIFCLLFLAYGLIVAGAFFAPASTFGSGLITFVTMAPLALERLPAELIPAILGGALAWTAPLRADNARTVLLMALSALVWLAFLHVQVIFRAHAVDAMGMTDYVGNLNDALGNLEAFAVSIRNFAAVIFAATIGIRLNDAIPGAAVARPPAGIGNGAVAGASPAGPRDALVAGAGDGIVAGHQRDGVIVGQVQEPEDVPDPALGQGKG